MFIIHYFIYLYIIILYIYILYFTFALYVQGEQDGPEHPPASDASLEHGSTKMVIDHIRCPTECISLTPASAGPVHP